MLKEDNEMTENCSPIIDLRQYALYPGSTDEFVRLFDREFVETQEEAGMRIIGQFRDLGDPNRFVWMRGFRDMPARRLALTAFYEQGEAWKRHATTANAMMIDSTDALLLRPLRAESAFVLDDAKRRPPLDAERPSGLVIATICNLKARLDQAFTSFYDDAVAPALREAGARELGLFTTEHSPNNFPRLPLREAETVFIWFLGFADIEAYDAHVTALGRNARWGSEIYPALLDWLQTRPQILRLAPTSRSQLRG